MNIQDLLSTNELLFQQTDSEAIYLEGAISQGSAEEIHLYENPTNRGRYLAIKRNDIVGDIAELDAAFLSSIGLSGFHVFRIAVKRGTTVREVILRHHKVGETIGPLPIKKTLSPSDSGCENNYNCQPQCCDNGDYGGCYCSNCCVGVNKRK